MNPSINSEQAVCAGVKGHGLQNVPGVCYDLGGRVASTRAVLSCAQDYLPGTLDGVEWVQLNQVANLLEAASELLKLVGQDCDQLERQLKAA